MTTPALIARPSCIPQFRNSHHLQLISKMAAQGQIRVAISGGGLAGACLAHSLLQYPHLDVHIFESATAFKEAVAAVGIVQNARRALDLIGVSATQCLEKAGAVPMQGVRWRMARGPDAGKEIDRHDGADEPITNIVHRADFLRELLADVPTDRIHASKKLVKVGEQSQGPVTLTFEDGTTTSVTYLSEQMVSTASCENTSWAKPILQQLQYQQDGGLCKASSHTRQVWQLSETSMWT